jgi:hypothetical protein
MAYRREEWKEDGIKREDWKEDGGQKRGAGGRYSSEKRSARKTRSGNEIEYNRKSGRKI